MSYWFYNSDEFGVEYDREGKELLRFPTEFLYPDYVIKDTCEKISEEVIYALKYINACSGRDFCQRNEHLTVWSSFKHNYLWAEGTTDNKVWITKRAENFLRAFMEQPFADLKEAISHCGYCEVISKSCIHRKFSIIIYNEQENYPIRLNCITIPVKAASFKTMGLLLSLFNTTNVKFDNGEILKLSAKDYNKSTTFHSPLVDDDALNIEQRAEELDIELNDYKIDEYGVCYSSDGRSLIIAPTNLDFYIIKEGTETIGDFAFNCCTHLKLLILPPTLKTLGVECLNCKELHFIYLPDSIEDIYFGAFNHCSSLKTIEYPSRLNYLVLDIQYCRNLQSIKMPMEITNLEISKGFGYECGSLKEIQIPRGQLSIYKKRFSWIKTRDFLQGFREYVEGGCIPGKDIRYRELALDYCKFWQKDWSNNSYYRCFNYGIRFIKKEKGTFYYKPYRNLREQYIWEICYDSEEMDEIINREILYNPFMFEHKIIAVAYYETYCIEESES